MIVIFVITRNHIFLAVVGWDLKFRQQQQLVAFNKTHFSQPSAAAAGSLCEPLIIIIIFAVFVNAFGNIVACKYTDIPF